MADSSEPLVLGYDNQRQCWTEGDITAKVRSLTEPDRGVPLTARLEVAPDILNCAPDYAEKDTFRAHVSLKSGAPIPASDEAWVTVIADPLMEMGLQIMSAVGGMPLQGLFKNLRARVRVQLVPYCLRIQANEEGREFEVSQQLNLEADGKTRVILHAAVYRVDGGGTPASEPTALAVTASSGLEGVKVETAPGEPGGVKVTLSCEKPLVGEGRAAGSLTFSAVLPGGRQTQRTVNVQLKPVAAELEVTPAARFRINAAPPQLVLTVKNSQGKAVAGLNTRWELEPAVGKLSSLSGTTDAAGQIKLAYSSPGLEEALSAFTAETLPVTVKVTTGTEAKTLASRELVLEFFALLPFTVEKAGFAKVSRQLELTRPGGATLYVNTVDGNKGPVAYARVSSNKQQVVTDSRGAAHLALGQSGAGGGGQEVSLELDSTSKDLVSMIGKAVEGLQHASWSTAFVGSSCQKLESFLRVDYVTRLAEEQESDYPDTVLNLKALYEVVRVGEHSMQLFERRFGRFREQLSSALGNLAGAFFTWLGDKYFPRIGKWLGDKVKSLLRYLAGKISGRAWLLARARGAVGTVRGWINRLVEKLNQLKRKVGTQRGKLPQAMDSKLNQNFDLPVRPGAIAPGEEAVRALEEATRKAADARKLHLDKEAAYKLLESEEKELRNKLAAALAQPEINSAEVARLRQAIGDTSSKAAQAGMAAREAKQALDAAATAESTARTALEDLRQMCAALDELLAAFMQALSKLYEYGAWLLAYLILGVGSALLANMRKVSGGVHAGAGDALDNAVQDLVTKQAFTVAFELGGYYVVGPAVYTGLMIYQGHALAVALEESQILCSRWLKLDKETMKDALRWYYEEIDAASFKTEETEVWLELSADLADWLEWLLVWITRLVNLLLGVVGAVVSLLTMGATIPAWLMVSAGFSAFIEGMDQFWDIIKAVGRSGTAVMGAAEVWGVVLPAHGSFTAKLYGDPSLSSRLDRGWTYPIDNDLRRQLQHWRDKQGTFPGEAALEGIYHKMNELGAQEAG